MTEQNEQSTTAKKAVAPEASTRKTVAKKTISKATAKKIAATKGTETGTSSSSASAPMATAALKANRKPWTAPALVRDLKTGKYSIPEALLQGPRKEVNAHSKALIAALQIMVDAYNQQIDEVTKANNVANNTRGILQGSVDQVKQLKGDVIALEQTLGVIGQALRCFGGEFNSGWTGSSVVGRRRVTSFQPYGKLLATYTTKASTFGTDSMTVGSSKDCAVKLRTQKVAVHEGRILLEGINTLQSSERYAANPEDLRRVLDKDVLDAIYAPDDGHHHHGVFVTTASRLKDLLMQTGNDELGLAEKIFGPGAAQRLREKHSVPEGYMTFDSRTSPFSARLHRQDPNS